LFVLILALCALYIGQVTGLSARQAATFDSAAGPGANGAAQAAAPSAPSQYLIPGGHTLGVKLYTDGLLVIGLTGVDTSGGVRNPAQDAGLQVGDMITHIDAKAVQSTDKLLSELNGGGGKPVTVRVRRGAETLVLTVTPRECAPDGDYKLGAWLRDSMAGIGTLTYIDPETKRFGALGHGINDVDTGRLMPLQSGSVMYATVESVRRGEAGKPGEIKGKFELTQDAGVLLHNSESGVFGVLHDERLNGDAEAVPIVEAADVKVGAALIRSNVDGDTVRDYQAEIVRIYTGEQGQMRDFMVRVTDEELLEKTGGIVQGMSGSPVLQDGRLVGAVTHVLINDPRKGYGIFIRHMMNADLDS
jgi:stage IV sporulation protein B